MRGQRWRLPVQPLGYVMSTKVIFRRAEVFFLAEVCLPRRPHANSVWCHFLLSLRTWEPGKTNCGRLGRQTSASTKTSASLKITFVDMTYPKDWTGSQRPSWASLAVCPGQVGFLFNYCLGQGNSMIIAATSFSKMLFLSTNVKRKAGAFSSSFGLKSLFEMLRFRDGLARTEGLTVEIKLRFQIPPA